MNRIDAPARANWQTIVESQGFHFHTAEGQPYWNESAYYQFTRAEIDVLEAATYELNRICLAAVEHLLNHRDRLAEFAIPADWIDALATSWELDEITIYGRFDLAYDGTGTPKLLECNADTPTGLLEAAVVQWHWLKDQHPDSDQFNSIHERLIEAWKRYRNVMRHNMVHFSSMDNLEDFMTVSYLQDTAVQAGLDATYIQCEDIGWNQGQNTFTDLNEQPIEHIFKLYPWEWLMRDAFGEQVRRCPTRWLEPAWKMILSNKAILAILWELFPDHPNLLLASLKPMPGPCVSKPLLGREGANITLLALDGKTLETGGKYAGPMVHQRYCRLPVFDGIHAVIGSWMVNGYACGIGVREDESMVTGNLSRFVPHLFY